MSLNYKKRKIIELYKEIILKSLKKAHPYIKEKKELNKKVKEKINELKLLESDFNNLKKEIINEISNPKHSLFVSSLENIINIIGDSVKIDYAIQDSDPALYYYENDKLYLINYDSIENKWYMSLIKKDTLELIKEIYSNTYEKFIVFLKNKSHWHNQ